MLETVIGALIALMGGFVGQWWAARRDDARWRRDAARRFHDERAKAYTEFYASARSWASSLMNWEFSPNPVPPSVAVEPADLDGLYGLLLPLKVFGSAEAGELAEKLIEAVGTLASTDGEEHGVFLAAETEFLRQVRADLDIEPALPQLPAPHR